MNYERPSFTLKFNYNSLLNFLYFKYLLLLLISVILYKQFQSIGVNDDYINMVFKYTNISIIIETDSFEYEEFEKTWGRVLSQIKFHVKSVYIYVHRHFNQKNNKASLNRIIESVKKMEAENISYPRVIISDLPENGYLPLMISSYTDDMYPLQVVCYINARNIQRKRHISNLIYDRSFIKNPLAQWIEKSYEMHINNPSLASVFGFQTNIEINENVLSKNFDNSSNYQLESSNNNKIIKKTVGCDIVMVKETVVRELLYYTKSSMDSPSPFLTLSLINDRKVQNSYDNLISTENIQNVDFFPFSKSRSNKIINVKANEEFKCPEVIDKELNEITFSVFIPCFKRNYFDMILSQIDNQTMQPSYYVFVQNRFYRYLDVEGEISHYLVKNKRPIYKIWMINYNSFFVLPNLITSLLNTDFVIRFDDDHIPTKNNLLSRVIRKEYNENKNGDVVIGDRPSILNILVGNFTNKDSIRIGCAGNMVDYVASPYAYRPIQMKLSGRLKPLFLGGGEDAHFGLSAQIECNLVSRRFIFDYRDMSGDEFRHGLDTEIKSYIHRTVRLPGHLIHNVYAYYVKIGLKPRCWKNFILDPRDRIDGAKYLHTSFF